VSGAQTCALPIYGDEALKIEEGLNGDEALKIEEGLNVNEAVGASAVLAVVVTSAGA
jgi:hypothetical protein